jgi:sortase A
MRLRAPSLRALSNALIIAGVMLLADVGVTLAWQEPLTAIYTWIVQHELSGDLSRLDATPPTPAELAVLADIGASSQARIAYLARELRRRAPEGSAVGRIRIPRINASYVVVKGTATADLIKGPGIYPQTPFPGTSGTVAIAGHRTTFLHPFRHLDQLHPGDEIEIEMPYAHLYYHLEKLAVVLPTDLRVIRPVGYDRLVLSACTPPFSASHRIIAFAREVAAVPEGAARPDYAQWLRVAGL